jgi:hypothetical protein
MNKEDSALFKDKLKKYKSENINEQNNNLHNSFIDPD